MTAIFKREFQSYFTSPVGYVVLAAYFFFGGLFFYAQCLFQGTSSMMYVFKLMFSIVLIIIPLITMRTFAEDRKQKTDQALLTSPVGVFSIVLAKYFSCLCVFALCSSVYLVEGLILSFFTSPDWSTIIGNVFGSVMLGSAFISIGMLISTLTESVVVAAISSFVINMLISLLDTIAMTVKLDVLTQVLKWLSFQSR